MLDFFLPLQPVLHDKKNTAWWAFSCSFEWYMICWVYSAKKSKFSGNKINGFYVSGFFVRWRPFSPKRNIKMESPETNDSGKVYMLGWERPARPSKKSRFKNDILQINLTNDGARYSNRFSRNSSFGSDCQFDFKTEREKAGPMILKKNSSFCIQ